MTTLWFWAGIICVTVIVVYQIVQQYIRDDERGRRGAITHLTAGIQIFLVAVGLISIFMGIGPKAKEVNTDLHTDTQAEIGPVKLKTAAQLEAERAAAWKRKHKQHIDMHREQVKEEANDMKDFLKQVENRRQK